MSSGFRLEEIVEDEEVKGLTAGVGFELQLCQARLKAIPEEQRRLVEGYRKGLYADFCRSCSG